jgi:PPOX class probable FMN-dependent enzyme
MGENQMARITTVDELRQRYEAPMERAVKKELTWLHKHHKRFIELSPFVAISSTGADGRGDVSPRGEKPGFVHTLDDRTLAIPDRPGNNRIDTLSNIVANPNVGLLFLLPGVNEILRVNGEAELRDDAELLARFVVNGKAPKLAILVSVREAYLHCAKALMRSALWDVRAQVPRSVLPSMSEMLHDQIGPAVPPESNEVLVERYKTQLY